MAEEQKFRKVDSKTYQVLIGGKWVDVDVPYGKVEALVHEFFKKGGMVDPDTGEVSTSITTLMTSFGVLGDILLSTYDEAGKLVEEKKCRGLALDDIPNLYLVATEIIGNFIKVVSNVDQTGPLAAGEGSEPKALPE